MKVTSDVEKVRVLSELLETAMDLGAHGLLTTQELAEIREVCAPPPTRPPIKVQSTRQAR